MKCENYLCIYQENGFCLLNKIELDIQGQCTDCTYPDIDENELQYLKRVKREELLS